MPPPQPPFLVSGFPANLACIAVDFFLRWKQFGNGLASVPRELSLHRG